MATPRYWAGFEQSKGSRQTNLGRNRLFSWDFNHITSLQWVWEPVVHSTRINSAVFISLKAFLYTSTKTGHRKKISKEESREDSRKQKEQRDTINIISFVSSVVIPFKASLVLGYKRKVNNTALCQDNISMDVLWAEREFSNLEILHASMSLDLR